MKQVESYLKNSQALLETLSTLRIPKHFLLVTLDIESLYTNISHEEAIIYLIRKFKGHPLIVFVLDLLKYVLKNNVFVFDNLIIFTQLCGIAMGTKLAPALATIGDLEQSFLTKQSKNLLCGEDISLLHHHTLMCMHSTCFFCPVLCPDDDSSFRKRLADSTYPYPLCNKVLHCYFKYTYGYILSYVLGR